MPNMSWDDGDGKHGPPAEHGLAVARHWIYSNPLVTEGDMRAMAMKIELGWGTPQADAYEAMTRVLHSLAQS
jgi:hypothetical protein